MHHEKSLFANNPVLIVHATTAGEPDETEVLHDFFFGVLHKEKSVVDFSGGVLHEKKSSDAFSIGVLNQERNVGESSVIVGWGS